MTREKGWHHPTVSWLSKRVHIHDHTSRQSHGRKARHCNGTTRLSQVTNSATLHETQFGHPDAF
eukprot:5027571-Prymnesium_polylepis.1